jgi:hypothetical protein
VCLLLQFSQPCSRQPKTRATRRAAFPCNHMKQLSALSILESDLLWRRIESAQSALGLEAHCRRCDRRAFLGGLQLSVARVKQRQSLHTHNRLEKLEVFEPLCLKLGHQGIAAKLVLGVSLWA